MPSMENRIICIFSTFPEKHSAADTAETLVSEGLAACVQIGSPVESTYVWNGKLCRETEYPAVIKASPDALPRLRERFAQLHPYECPEWVQTDCEASRAYADFVCGTRPL